MDQQDKELRNDLIMWDRRRKLAVVQVVFHVVYWYMQRKYHLKKYVDHPINYLEREKVRIELMTKLKCIKYCRNITRMGPQAFQDLCHILERDGGQKPTKRATVEEQVAKCLYILSHSVKNRNVSFFFRRSGETDCIGALDGTHVRVKVSSKDVPRYRGKKGYPTQNVLVACSFDLKFTYVLPGWKGTASDSRIIKNALTREDKLKIPNGKFYLVDAGYMLRSSLIPPYRGVRYHLKEYSNHPPENARELFNHRHASLRNAIERAFGVLKKRFPIIASTIEPTYSVNTQSNIVIACCILHNFLMGVDPDENITAEVDKELENQCQTQQMTRAPRDTDKDAKQAKLIRNVIAATMWSDYVANQE
ncbi:putative nuclease HARBI1 [Camellia sinensis]|uniref:putative nuclease HARBI1 n=1 Tax=Camellia sinensis TaxID=4442 RepID=UPI0010365896|nr:putative nuclease HARBI1 [Camellia sinensis]